MQKLIFQGKYIQAHKLFGRNLMGYPVEQQKYQSFGDLILKFSGEGEARNYTHRLDLDRAIVTTEYEREDICFKEMFL
ncbi:MAG: glycoside hydrolase N-terminal domain-containing protein [Candidatus Aminicenantes bacterium]|nr:MAG: glycoside hydrolase N-terminal domain-containing protein [Candidatus Aminicenantes bacterium]